MRRQPPAYFESVRSDAEKRWDQLEGDPELAGPWRQLFAQVQGPRHVVSELLQNADDAGARRVQVSLRDGLFVFEHDGKDFIEEEFRSLCRFGYSNKRLLRTIGFRGVGFKSTFSLGDVVEVLTPSLAVRFHERRFTEPVWMDDAPPCELTRISVAVQDPSRGEELSKNLQEWTRSAVPLLFFNAIEELAIGGVTLRKHRIGPGPLECSERIRLSGQHEHDVLVFTSPEEPFPEEAVTEIRRERNVVDLDLPPCKVELVVGLPGPQKLYVVLPTGVTLDTPFSCNAPFIQDPARSAVKSPSVSPTNRWLLQRAGRLAGEAMLEWLGNQSLQLDGRAEAYRLLPKNPTESDTLDADVTSIIAHEFARAAEGRPILLTTDGSLVRAKGCLAPPEGAYPIWTPRQLARVFGDAAAPVLHEAVSRDQRQRLQSWGWLDVLNDADLVRRLDTEDVLHNRLAFEELLGIQVVRRLDTGGVPPREIPRPDDDAKLLALWELVQRTVRQDWGGERRRRLAIVPVEGAEALLPANDVVRLPRRHEAIPDETWQFLIALVRVVDPQFLSVLERAAEQSDSELQAARQLLNDVGLAGASKIDVVAAHAWERLWSRDHVSVEDLVTMSHLLAALDATAPGTFHYVTRDGRLHSPDAGIIGTQDPLTEAILPQDWAAAHLLHDAYFTGHRACTNEQWRRWSSSNKSRLLPFVPLDKPQTFVRSELKREVCELVRSRGSNQWLRFYDQVQRVRVDDFGFPEALRSHWEGKLSEDAAIWAKVTERVLSAPPWYWKDCLQAKMRESNYTNTRLLGDPFVAEWIADLRARPSLYDVYGRPSAPAELFLRTPETEPLQGVEPFVRGDLDNEQTKPLLRALGVRDTPTGLGSLLERIRALARVPDPTPLLGEIVRWYGALDRVLARADASMVTEARQAFASEALILSAENQWLRVDEVFLEASEEYPDPPLVHPAVGSLPMWTRLGVARRPSAERVLEWLKSLPSGGLKAGDVKRVTAALRRYPSQVWQTCEHWLALDGTWSPVATLRYRLAQTDRVSWGTLFPHVRASTADFRMLDADTCDRQPFADLPDIGAVVEYPLTRRPATAGQAVEKPWLLALARALARVRLPDDAETQHIRQVAARLARSVWQPFHAGDSLEVTPYIDGVPAGSPYCRDVLWHEQCLFVRDGSVARSFDALAAELGAPFGNAKVADTIRACIERHPDFVSEYMDEHFELEPAADVGPYFEEARSEEAEVREGAQRQPDEVAEAEPAPGPPAREAFDDDEAVAGTEESERRVRVRRERERPLFERFASGMGYRWDEKTRRFVREDGSWIQRSEPPFDWEEYDAAGTRVKRYWVSAQCLERGGVEIGADVWGHFERWPDECSMVLVHGNGYPRKLDGSELARLVSEGHVRVYPAKYRLREETA